MPQPFFAALLVALVSTTAAFAQSPVPSPPATLAPAVAVTPAPSASPELYTPISCVLLVKRANLDKKAISAHALGALSEAALRAHDFDGLFAAANKAKLAAAKDASAAPAATSAVNAAAKALYRAQADVRACFGLR